MWLIKEFIDALTLEIEAIQKGKGGGITSVQNGNLMKKILDQYIYQFTLENFLSILDDTPAIIEINGKEYDCDIISTTGLKVQIAIKHKLTDNIPSAKIKTNTAFLLERLKKKYEEHLQNPSKFENSIKLFKGDKSRIDGGNFNTSYSISNNNYPNPYQNKAIESSINYFLSIIWGPPGTGKTQTIAKAIENHLNLGRKVLLLSHSNNAVDQALLKVAHQTKKSYYKDGKLVRLGIPKPEMSDKYEKEECNFVMLEKIAEKRSLSLINEKGELNKKIEKIRNDKQRFDTLVKLFMVIEGKKAEIEEKSTEILNIESEISALEVEIIKIEIVIKDLNAKLIKAKDSNFLKRKIFGLDPVKIELNLRIETGILFKKKNKLKELHELLFQVRQNLHQLKNTNKNNEEILSNSLNHIRKSYSEIQKEIENFEKAISGIQFRLNEIIKEIEVMTLQILKEAKLVATTLTKSYLSKEIENIDFDILLVDEVSMAPMPMLFWAASKIKKGITIVGDFKQLPPICLSDDEIAKKWLGRSIFDELQISEISQAINRVAPLLRQYRMHPSISEIVNRRIYDNRLEDDESVKNKIKIDNIAGNAAVCIIDTSAHNPWCSQMETGGRFNLINAMICVNLAEKISKSFRENESIGIVTPYRNQAILISKIAEDKNLLKNGKIRVNTVHSFQGGEETIIIFDSVEGNGAKKWSMINENNNEISAKLLLNVAFTRAESKLFIIANYDYITSTFQDNTLFKDILNDIINKGKTIKSTEIFSDFKDDNFDYWASKFYTQEAIVVLPTSNHDESDFWVSFHNDLVKTKSELIIFSPYLTAERFGKLKYRFHQLLTRGVKISVITLPPNDKLQLKGAEQVVEELKNMKITVKFRNGMHEKIAIIDKKIEWSGSLNILSHNKRKEYMKRFEGDNTVKELFQRFDLEKLLYSPNLNGERCPECKVNFIRTRTKYGKSFYACSGYPNCEFTARLSTKNLEELENKKINTDSIQEKNQVKKSNSIDQYRLYEKDLFGNAVNGIQWETPKAFWSSVSLPGYKFSKNKNAWYKEKRK